MIEDLLVAIAESSARVRQVEKERSEALRLADEAMVKLYRERAILAARVVAATRARASQQSIAEAAGRSREWVRLTTRDISSTV